MAVREVSGQGPPALAHSPTAQTPSLRPHGATSAEGAPSEARVGPGPGEEHAQRVESQPIEQDTAAMRAATRLRVDQATRRIITQILNGNNEVIKQIPPEQLLKIMANVRRLLGLFFDVKV